MLSDRYVEMATPRLCSASTYGAWIVGDTDDSPPLQHDTTQAEPHFSWVATCCDATFADDARARVGRCAGLQHIYQARDS